jgi:replication factor C subunit 3/5
VWEKPEASVVDVRGGARAKVRTFGLGRTMEEYKADLARSDQITEKTPIPPPDWEALIEVIAKDMIEERSPARILQVRAKLYDLLTHCIPATTILKVCGCRNIDCRHKSLTCHPDSHIQAHAEDRRRPEGRRGQVECILRAQDQEWKRMCSAAHYTLWATLTNVQKVIFHLEAFVAKFMRLYEG